MKCSQSMTSRKLTIYPHRLNEVFGSKFQDYQIQASEKSRRIQQPKLWENNKQKEFLSTNVKAYNQLNAKFCNQQFLCPN